MQSDDYCTIIINLSNLPARRTAFIFCATVRRNAAMQITVLSVVFNCSLYDRAHSYLIETKLYDLIGFNQKLCKRYANELLMNQSIK